MEVIGVAASFIAIGQALIAGRHVVDLLQKIPRIGNELASLNNEIESLRAAVEAAELRGVASLRGTPETPDLRLARTRLEETAKDLENIRQHCTRTIDDGGKIKAKKTRWFLLQSDLRECRGKIRDARGNLQLALLTLNLRETSQIAVRVENFTIHSFGQKPPTREATESAGENLPLGPPAPPSRAQIQPIDMPIQDITQQLGQLAVSKFSDGPHASQPSLETEMIVFRGKLSIASGCPCPCWCRCHVTKSTFFEPAGWARNLLGSFSITYNQRAVFGRAVECSQTNCKGNQKTSTTFDFKFPAWFFSRYISFRASMNTSTGWRISLRPVRVLSDSAPIWHILQMRTRTEVQEYMLRHGPLFPDDYHHSGGYGLLECAISAATPDVLEFLVQFWNEELRKETYNHWSLTAQVRRELADRPKASSQKSDSYRRIIFYGEDISGAAQTPLHQAACSDSGDADAGEAIRKAFGQYPWAIAQWNHEGRTPLELAAMYGNLKALQALINLGCDVNQPTFSGRTALMGAAQMGHIHVAKYLLSAGCSSNATSLKGSSAMHFAVCPMNEPADDPPSMIRVLLAAGASATAVDLLGNTALHLLDDSRFGSDATATKIRLLVEAGANINARNNDGGSALFRAIRRNQPQVVSCLLNAGAATENYRQLGGSLLHDAALYAGLEVLRCLEGMKTSRMKADVLDAEGDSPWDCFIYVLKLPEWELGSLRKPGQEEKEHFVSLYRTIRDRDLQLDIDRLEWTRRYLVNKDARAASALEQLVQENETLGQWSLVRTFKTIALQVREKMWDAAVEAVEENIDLLHARMNQSPWLQTSRYDYMGNMELDHKR